MEEDMKKRFYIRKATGNSPEADYYDKRAVIDRVWDKVICRCYSISDAINIKRAMNASYSDKYDNIKYQIPDKVRQRNKTLDITH